MKRLLAVCLFAAAFVPLFAQDKPMIAVLDFSTDGVSRSEMKTIITLLSSALFQTRKFTVIDVNERERLLKELEFSVGECTDESCLLEVGRMLSAERIVVGNIGKVGTRYILSCKMLETESARTLNTADGIYASLDALVDDLFGLAEQLALPPGVERESDTATDGRETAPAPAVEEPESAEPAGSAAPAEAAEPGVTAAAGNHWTLGFEAGADIPVGSAAEALGIGVPALVRFGYALERDWGALRFEALSGFEYQGSRADVRYGYNLLTVPLGAAILYNTRWASPWYLTVGAAGGVTFNFVVYKEAYPFRDNLLNISAFAAPSAGVGYRISPRVSLELQAYLWMVFYTDLLYLGAAPVLGLRMAL